MRTAVIGAGVGGLAAAHRLTGLGYDCDVYERWPGLGGQAATLDVGEGMLLERYYHMALTTDRDLIALFGELGLGDKLEWLRSNVAVFADGQSHPFTSPLDILRFSPLSVGSRLRMALAGIALQRRGEVDLAGETARRWVERTMGREAYAKVWGPALRGKFGDRADEISMAWLQSKLLLRRRLRGRELREEVFGYPRGSWEVLFRRLRERIEDQGGRVLIDRPAARIARDGDGFEVTPGAPGSYRRGHDPRGFEPDAEPERYDAVLATVPSDVFERLLDPPLLDALAPGYIDKLRGIEYYAAVCLLLELDRQFTRFYWTTISDPELPFVGLIEHTSIADPARYGGRRFLYVANYRPPGDPLLTTGAEELLDLYLPGLRRVNPRFTPDWVRRMWVHREPAAQPVVTVGYGERIPPRQTGVPGLMLANTTQIFPEDRGTNYAVRLAHTAVRELLATSPRTGDRSITLPDPVRFATGSRRSGGP